MSQQSNDERDYDNETAMKIDETMVNLRQSTFEPDAEFIMISSSSRSDDEIKRRKRQVDETQPNEVPDENPTENELPSEASTATTEDQTDEDPSVNLEVETSITKGPTTTFIGGIPLSIITRPNTTTTTTTTKGVAMRGKVTYYTKKPIIFPSETTTKFTVGPLVRQQATTASHKAAMAATSPKNMKIASSTTKKVVKKIVKTTKKVTRLTTKKTMKPKVLNATTVKTTVKGVTTKKIR
ncbi:probable serine/threonine-protein kinase nek3 [Chironomus tepperi]|uniref:probable serine/threonine-protein kinase nek3 n=1 Tax=Chironomus tepperi TaxID=113505 RepID=UPI00391F434A